MSKLISYQLDTLVQQGHKPKADNNLAIKDSIIKDSIKTYGIKNYQNIPIRKVKVQQTRTVKEFVPADIEPKMISQTVNSWQIIILLLSVVFIAFSKAFNLNRVRQLTKALVNYSVAQEVIREEKVFFHRANLWLSLVHILTTSLFVYGIGAMLNYYVAEGLMSYFIIAGVFIVIYFVKYIFSKILFFVFNGNELSTEYIFSISIYNNLQGVLLIPVLTLSYFTDLDFQNILIYCALPVFVIPYLFRLHRISIVGIHYKISYFYIFLYICTLEILPLVVLYKIFVL